MASASASNEDGGAATIADNPFAAGAQVQLHAPVRLRPFKSAYNVRQGNEVRLICHAARGYPTPHITWFVGNKLVDDEFLRAHSGQFRVLHHRASSGISASLAQEAPASPAQKSADNDNNNNDSDDPKQRRIVEIHPAPANKHGAPTSGSGGLWVEYREPSNEKYAIDTSEQRRKYLVSKLAQLANPNASSSSSSSASSQRANAAAASSAGQQDTPLSSQASLSVLVINSAQIEQHTARYACRATTRANTEEVTTVLRVQGKLHQQASKQTPASSVMCALRRSIIWQAMRCDAHAIDARPDGSRHDTIREWNEDGVETMNTSRAS